MSIKVVIKDVFHSETMPERDLMEEGDTLITIGVKRKDEKTEVVYGDFMYFPKREVPLLIEALQKLV